MGNGKQNKRDQIQKYEKSKQTREVLYVWCEGERANETILVSL
jgi:hypothetical protein